MSKSRKVKDPFAAREAERYADPIPSREFILQLLAEAAQPLAFEKICRRLDLDSEERQEALRRRLIAMSRDGQLVSNRRGVFGLPDRMELSKGRVQGNRDGYGYFIPVEGGEDLLLSPLEMQKVFDGDIVLARAAGVDRRGRKEGVIVEVLVRRPAKIVGRFYREHGFGILVPDNRRINHEIIIPHDQCGDAADGQFVLAEIITWPTERLKPVARVMEVLGDSTTPGLEIDLAIHSHGLPHQWPAEVEREAAQLARARLDAELSYRLDLRQLAFVTIDGEDAKDFDDAVHAEPLPAGGWRLLVAIADVSHYVATGTALDREAQNRGNSVYFPGHVIPMLPEVLSNDLCSLKPDVDRLVMVCEMQISAAGELVNYRFFEGVIHSHARMTYTEVAAILEAPANDTQAKQQARLRKRYAGLVPHFETLYALYLQLHTARIRGGALDFDTTETRIVFGENRRIREIVPVVRNHAHRLIEECMLCANVATARLLQSAGLPVLYRVHGGPGEEKLQLLRDYLRETGLMLGGGERPRPRDYQALLARVAERPDSHLLQTMIIRSLMQAVYQPENIGHFGLGYEAYTHFTSPIRRYPDLLIHRAIRFLLRSGRSGSHLKPVKGSPSLPRNRIYPYDNGDIAGLGDHCSMTERRADAASYDVVNWLKCEYMQAHLGEEFNGTVASVTSFGLFVELDDIYIEGLLHITALENDYYHFDLSHHRLVGERSGRQYAMGDALRVVVAAVSLDERKIDLALVGTSRSRRDTKDTGGRRRTATDSRNGGTSGRGKKPAATGGKAGKTGNTAKSQRPRDQGASGNKARAGAGKSKRSRR